MIQLHRMMRRFAKGTRASIPVMTALLMIPMTLAAGGAVDFVAHEKIRVALQDALDRGVLAAASLTQTEDPKALITSYLKSVPGSARAVLTISEERRTNFRKISASVSIPYETTFLKLAKVQALNVAANATAQEARQNIEMSMVLDISGSMLDNGGIYQLRPAAKSFLDIVLKEEVRPVTSVSIVPFAGTVNLRKGVFDLFAGPAYLRKHGYSSCFEMLDADFSPGTPAFALRDQVPHFTYYNYNVAGKQPWWCPTDDAAITYPTNDLTYLKAQIEALRPFDGTGTAYGMKWAELLLNPSMRESMKTIGDKNLAPIPSAFRSRPAAFDDKDTLKFIVLMTDGQIGFQPRTNVGTYVLTDRNAKDSGYHRVPDLYSDTQAIAFYKRVCTYAKKEGIVIFTIAFKVTPEIAANIATCASDPSYAYKVDGLDMGSAFQSIATTMQKIRLVN